jgi:hypothetical protein
VILTENSSGQRRDLLLDGLGSTGQAMSGTTQIVAWPEFDLYGNPVNHAAGVILTVIRANGMTVTWN